MRRNVGSGFVTINAYPFVGAGQPHRSPRMLSGGRERIECLRSAAGQSDIDRVRDATDLVHLIGEHITLRPKGREHVGLCPFHDDHSPSMAVVTHKGNAFYKCHSCGAGGDAFDFVRNYHKMDFPEALRYLAERAGITLTPRTRETEAESSGPRKADLREANGLAAMFFRKVLQSPGGEIGRHILSERGVSDAMSEAFLLGLAPDQWDALLKLVRKRGFSESTFAAAGLLKPRKEGDGYYDAFRNRLIFPICNEVGQPVAFGARKIDPEDEPKYLNSSESPLFQKSKTLYGLHLAKRPIIEARRAIVTEGYTDVIACHQAGVCNVVGTLGTALTRDHARILSRLCDEVVLLFDGDEAGQKAADRGVEVFFAERVDIKICVLPDGVDPDDLLRQEGGRERFIELIAASEEALAFKVRRFRRVLDAAGGLSARQKALEQFLGELADMGFGAMQGVRKRLVMTQLADLLGITLQDVAQAMPVRRTPLRAAHDQGRHDPGATAHGPTADDAISAETSAEASADAVLPCDGLEETMPVSRARLRAEHDLLAVLLYEPGLGLKPVAVGEMTGSRSDGVDGEAELAGDVKGRAVQELFRDDHFLDGASRRIARAVFSFFSRRETFTMQQVLAELGQFEGEAKTIAAALYFEGQRRCGEAEEIGECPLAIAARAFIAHVGLESYQRSLAEFRGRQAAPEPLADLQRLIEARRKQGIIAGAISVGVRG